MYAKLNIAKEKQPLAYDDDVFTRLRMGDDDSVAMCALSACVYIERVWDT